MKKTKLLKAYIKLRLAYPHFKKQLFAMEHTIGSKWIILGTPIHDNLGDHLITQSEFSYLTSLCGKTNIFEVPTEMFLLYREQLRHCIKSEDIIFINGGGWMGTLWKNDEILMQEMILTFKKNKIIIFPQTIYYENGDSEYQTLLHKAQNVWQQAPSAFLCLRDQQSFDFASKALIGKKERCFLLPDIALIYPTTCKHVVRNNTILFCLRNDRELILSPQVKRELENYIKNMGQNFLYTSTLTKRVVTLDERQRLLTEKIDEFASARLVITDRLHGMIFSFLASTPCIAIDNKTHKVSGVYTTWLNGIDNIILSSPEINALKENIHLSLKKFPYETQKFQETFRGYYSVLERILKNE